MKTLIANIVNERVKIEIPIINTETEAEIGYLSPVTLSTAENPEIVEKMTNWRNKNSDRFLTRFTATPERTRKWLQHSILADPNRLLSLMYAKIDNETFYSHKLIGYLGFFNLTDISAEGDAIIRGEHGGGIDFIKYAAIAKMDWFFTQFKPRGLMCRILSNNEAAINMSLAVGYEIEKEVNLYRHGDIDEKLQEWGEESQLVSGIKLVYLKAKNPYHNQR